MKKMTVFFVWVSGNGTRWTRRDAGYFTRTEALAVALAEQKALKCAAKITAVEVSVPDIPAGGSLDQLLCDAWNADNA